MAVGATRCVRFATNVGHVFTDISSALSVRHKSTLRGRGHGERSIFQRRFDANSTSFGQYNNLKNIGFPVGQTGPVDKEQQKLRKKRKTNFLLEFAARHRHLKLNMDAVSSGWLKEQAPYHIHNIAEHYNIYHDLFGGAFFYSTTPMSVCYDYDERFVTPVYFGNRIPPSEAAGEPFVNYDSDDNCLWTVVMTSPDGNLQHNDKECLHWLVANIPGSDLHKGERLCDYLQPFPVKGAGYMRYVFVLYKQKKHIDFSLHRRCPNCRSLTERTFSSEEFYQQYREHITPASICFFQSRWDLSVKSVFHDVLEMKEPLYEFVPPVSYMYSLWRNPKTMSTGAENLRGERDKLEEVLEKIRASDILREEAHDWPHDYSLQLISNPPLTELQYKDNSTSLDAVPSPWVKLRLKSPRLEKHQVRDICSD